MSLKKYKTKQDLLSENFDLKLEINEWYTAYWDWDDDDDWDCDYYCDQCGSVYCQGYQYCSNYETIEFFKSQMNWRVISKSGRWSVDEPRLPGVYIDMESIYGKIEKRNRRIDIVLGLLKDDKYIPTIGDLFPIKK